MRLLELEDNDVLTGYYDPTQDQITLRRPDQTRKPTLTLLHLNRLKKMRALKKLEDLKRQDLLGILYAPAEAPAGGSPF